MNKKQISLIIIIAFFIGALGSMVLGRFVVPYVATFPHFNWLNKVVTTSPIVINRTQEVQLNEGVNLIDLIKQSGNVTVSIYTNSASAPQFLGNGFLVTSDGLIFTTDNVLQSITTVTVVLNDGRSFAGTVRAKDPKSNLVAVTVEAQNLPVAQFDPAAGLDAGQRVLYLGQSNTELTHNFLTGFVDKTVGNDASLQNQDYTEQLNQTFTTDVSAPADFFGGPIFDLNGHVVGISVADGQVITSENIQTALTAYLASGKIIRPSLGLKYFVLSKELADLKGLPQAGILVGSADKLSPAAAAGLQANDLITAMDGQDLGSNDFEQLLNTHTIGDMILTVWRAGSSIQLTVKLAAK